MPWSRDEHHRVEQELLQALKAAEKEYRAAAKQYAAARRDFQWLLDHPDGAFALHKAARNEALVLERYARAVRRFSDFVMHGQMPDDTTGGEL